MSIEKTGSQAAPMGGSYSEVRKSSTPGVHEVHHMPADSNSLFVRGDGASIRMEKADHRLTASCGNSVEAKEYREMQSELMFYGEFDDAFQMDIDDIHEKFGDKYDREIEAAGEYWKEAIDLIGGSNETI